MVKYSIEDSFQNVMYMRSRKSFETIKKAVAKMDTTDDQAVDN